MGEGANFILFLGERVPTIAADPLREDIVYKYFFSINGKVIY